MKKPDVRVSVDVIHNPVCPVTQIARLSHEIGYKETSDFIPPRH